ncbi:MAG TPA: agmatine deiminase family protein [Parvularculaceae bacterium]|nr:agmatine deiminase family protein [Amphiplicatus sp.]MCB9955430.1 agmatine deiminase family protein [Caulobacterales bacterium]HOP20644.1 agmatine deiminase family protein [Amphiplicatus sp.]HPE32485.1 agmatine deiminase family protein [Parvularculaceae bacterium]
MGFSRRQPAEWAPHAAVWIGWPSAADLWEEDLAPAQAEVASFIRAILFPDVNDPKGARTTGEPVDLVYNGAKARAAAEAFRAKLPIPNLLRLHEAPMGDIWLRDTGPIFVTGAGRLAASAFTFNGWGGKYQLGEDERLADIISEIAGVPLKRFDGLIAEGGALEPDGEGTVITTRQCLLNPNRNPGLSEKDIEAILREAIGAEKVIWLDEGLAGDHTDGHVDNLARFIAPGKVICQHPTGDDDPNKDVLNAIRETLSKATGADGRKLEVIEIPSPGAALMDDEPVAASHMNFYIANHSVVMPSYGALSGEEEAAEQALAILHDVAGRPHAHAIDASHLLTGGGSFHCISQQQP